MRTIAREELKAKMDRADDFMLVEALSHEHYASSHLPGAINLPYEFVDEAERVLPEKDAEIVVYCMNRDCSASREEARELEEMGYARVLHSMRKENSTGSRPAFPSRVPEGGGNGEDVRNVVAAPQRRYESYLISWSALPWSPWS